MKQLHTMTTRKTLSIGLSIFLVGLMARAGAQTSPVAPVTVASAKPADFKQPSPDTPELNQKVTIQPDGYITLQNVGSLYVQGMTVPELVEALKKSYANILHDPIIDVDLIDFQKPFFVISGQVTKPGQYDLRADITVSEAIAVAGGFLPTAKTQVFLYHRVSINWVEVKKLKLNDILHGKKLEEDVQMQPGDMLFVPEKFITNFRKYVPYNPGVYVNPAVN